MAQIHKCGQCEKQFNSEATYIAHICDVTGFKPSQPEHQGPDFVKISEAAIARGEARKGETVHPSVALNAEK